MIGAKRRFFLVNHDRFSSYPFCILEFVFKADLAITLRH
jgi:hypothetical protein